MKARATKWMSYPAHLKMRNGIKVSWLMFEKETDAHKASQAAKNNAILQASKGYDFGYCTPGEIEKTKDGLYSVCIP